VSQRPPLDPDPRYVAPVELVEPVRPTATGRALGCLAVLISAAMVIVLGWLLATAIAAPRSAADPAFAVAARPSSGAPRQLPARSEANPEYRAGRSALVGVPLLAGGPSGSAPLGASEPATSIGTALQAGYATHCKPTPTKCQGWGGNARLGAVPGYDGPPYAARVCRLDDLHRCVVVTVVSSCACGDRHGRPTVIDLSLAAFTRLAPESAGIVLVTLESPIGIALPPTDTAP